MSFTPKPVTFSDEIDKSRDVMEFNKWGQSSRFIKSVMFILSWFTIPVEVLFRRNFGQRWFTTINFYAGLLVLGIFASVQYISAALRAYFFSSNLGKFLFPNQQAQYEYSFWDSFFDSSMILFMLTYMLLGSYHRFRIWWRNRTNTALHSFDDGTSRFEPIARYVMRLINVLAVPGIWFYMRLLPRKERRKKLPIPRLMDDVTAFTNTVFEPLLLFILAYYFDGIVSLWLFISGIALMIYANWKESAKLNKALDFRDSVIEARQAMSFAELEQPASAGKVIMQQAAVTIKDNPQVAPRVTQQYPDLMSIIDEMNSDKGHLAN